MRMEFIGINLLVIVTVATGKCRGTPNGREQELSTAYRELEYVHSVRPKSR
jgi:hypothetical protein